jgi:hypothetical protein
MALAGDILINFISALIFVAVNGLVLKWLAGLFKLNVKESWKLAYTVALFAGIVSFVLGFFPIFIVSLAGLTATIIFFAINAVVLVYLIMRFYKLEIGKALLMWLGVFIADLIIGFVIGLIIGLISGLLLV